MFELECEVKVRVYEEHGSRLRLRKGCVTFDTVQEAQVFCESPRKMLDELGAEAGSFELWEVERRPDQTELALWWTLKFDGRRDVNYLPIEYREFVKGIYNMERSA